MTQKNDMGLKKVEKNSINKFLQFEVQTRISMCMWVAININNREESNKFSNITF